MERRLIARAIAVAAAIAVELGPAVPASALPPGEKGPSTMMVTGLAPDGATLYGRFRPEHFADSPAGMSVDGLLTGTLSRAGALQTRFSQQIVLPVDRGQTEATCRFVNIALGPEDPIVAGNDVHIDQMLLNISAPQGPGSRLVVPLCQAELLLRDDPARSDPSLTAVFNEMLSLLGQGG